VRPDIECRRRKPNSIQSFIAGAAYRSDPLPFEAKLPKGTRL
jgi:hypothetical protein